MTSVQRYLSGHDNYVRTAALTASSVRPSTAVERLAATRAGGGRVRLEGAYTGQEPTDIDVEIVAAGGVPRASVPTFAGVGNGTMTVLDIDGAAPLQGLTFSLRDLGVQTEHARRDVREVVIRARVAGAAGNSIRITVAPALTRTATEYALLSDWPAGARSQVGDQWDFGGLPLSASGELDVDTPRVQFGADPTVYRLFREYRDGVWRHGVSPLMERTVPAGTRVWAISGGYDVTVTDGVDSELYEGVVTFYELLSALGASDLVEVAGVVAADRRVGGQAAVDVPLRTSAWLLGATGRVRLEQVSVPAAAPTQTVTVRCVNADVVGAERWSVSGSVSGELDAAVTGRLYTSAAASFLVPPKAAAHKGGGEWSFKYDPVTRSETEGLPSVCVRPFRFGRNARARTVTFRYQRRPAVECSCSDMPAPLISARCLGLEEIMDTNNPEYVSRVKDIYAWREDFIRANTQALAATSSSTPVTSTPEQGPFYIHAVFGSYASNVRLGAQYTTRADAEAAAAALISATVVFSGWGYGNGSAFGTVAGLSWQHNSMMNSADYPPSQGGPDAGTVDVTAVDVLAAVPPGVSGGITSAAPVRFLAYERDLDWMNSVIPIMLSALAQVFEHEDARALWDDLWTEVQADLAPLSPTQDDLGADPAQRNARFLDRYLATVDNILLEAGILPKSDASLDAGGCWRDYPDEAYWWADVDGYYLPAFTNRAYISARRETESGRVYSTMEFGFGLLVACPERLRVGDTVTIRIHAVDADRPYQVGDVATLDTVAAGPAWLAGGVDGTDELTWSVFGSDAGALPDYVVPLDAPAPAYSAAGVELRIVPGGIPFSLGDRFAFAVEAGQFRWRRDGGSWSTSEDIPGTGVAALNDGVSAVFVPGAAPSFVPDDVFSFRVHQPHAVSHVRRGFDDAWAWVGASAALEIDFGEVRPVSALALARYSLPAGAAVTAELSVDAVDWSAPVPIDVTRSVAVAMLPTASARYVRISVAGGEDGLLGWVWAGVPASTTYHASRCEPVRRYAVSRGNGLNPAALYAGRGVGWSVAWDSLLFDADVAKLVDIVDWMQAQGEPIVFVPHHLHPRDAALVRAGSDALELPDFHDYQPDDAGHRLLSAVLTLDPVLS